VATPKNLLAMRRRMASVFHEPLLLDSTVYANAALGLKLRGFDRRQIDQRLRPWLERLGIGHLMSRRVRTLSGGEAQRTSLVRGLALNPDLLLMDEPFSALDAPTRKTLLLDLQDILADTEITTVMVTHELEEAAALGQRIGVLSQGKLLQLAAARDIFMRPASVEVAGIVGTETCLPAVVEEESSGGTSLVRFNGGTVRVEGEFHRGTRVTLCVRAEDISVVQRDDHQTCAKETVCIGARVCRVVPSATHYRIALESDCGRVVALVGRSKFTELSLREGDEVVTSFSCKSIHVI
jgi:ABC-type sugar transport system ATPase subunit